MALALGVGQSAHIARHRAARPAGADTAVWARHIGSWRPTPLSAQMAKAGKLATLPGAEVAMRPRARDGDVEINVVELGHLPS